MRLGSVVGGAIFGGAALWACSSFDAERPEAGGAVPVVEAGVGDSAPTKLEDAAGVDAAGGDAESGTSGRCSLTAPFGNHTALATIGGFTQLGGVRLSRDELRIFFWSRQRLDSKDDHGQSDLFVAQRPSTADLFGDVQTLTALNSSSDDDAAPTFTRDELTVYFTRVGAGERVLYSAQRTATDKAFGTPVPLPVPKQSGGELVPDDGTPWVRPDGSALYFSSFGRPDTSAKDYDIFLLPLPSSGKSYERLETLRAPAGTGSSTSDSSAVLSDDELTVYFKSQREDPSGDIWIARRNAATDPFGTPARVVELSTPQGDVPMWLSPDGCLLYWVTNGFVYYAQRGK